jgi:DNA-binding transcriptional LysR family regulator
VPRVEEETSGALAVVTLVAGGFGVALVPASLSNLHLPGVTYRPIKGRCRTSDLTLVWRRDGRASTVQAFLEVVRKEYLRGVNTIQEDWLGGGMERIAKTRSGYPRSGAL